MKSFKWTDLHVRGSLAAKSLGGCLDFHVSLPLLAYLLQPSPQGGAACGQDNALQGCSGPYPSNGV
ncbi:hypothetical protein [Acidilobus sp.]|uniref:hypothetical protein n=1 Tax=Acidilobus sp. TaxID=1872109 RepID=UPI003D087B16